MKKFPKQWRLTRAGVGERICEFWVSFSWSISSSHYGSSFLLSLHAWKLFTGCQTFTFLGCWIELYPLNILELCSKMQFHYLETVWFFWVLLSGFARWTQRHVYPTSQYSTWCSMNYVASQSGCWEKALILPNLAYTVLFNPFGWFFPWPQVVPYHTCNDQPSPGNLKGTLGRSLELAVCGSFLSNTLSCQL